MVQTKTDERNVIFFIADISGYTKFILTNEKDLAHSQVIIRDLINTIIQEVKAPIQLLRLEGDAIFLYIDKDEPSLRWEFVQPKLLEKLITIFRVFSQKIQELSVHKICTCNACNNVDKLRLKIISHSGYTLFFHINNVLEVTGKDAIIAHRLLKNSVHSKEYVLLTESAFNDLTLTQEDVEQGEEFYEDIGKINTYVYYPPAPEPYVPDPNFTYPKIFVDTLRLEVSREYAVVANHPEEGFHFHTGRRLLEILEYDDVLLEGFDEKTIESFAGTGNIFNLGEIKSGENVLDIGCGAGLDSLIAARMAGDNGHVIGIDMTVEMIEKARRSAASVHAENVEFFEGYSENLPVTDEWADVVISNGAINLSPDKHVVFGEMFRVLKPGGRLQISDILVSKPVPDSAKNNIDLWAG